MVYKPVHMEVNSHAIDPNNVYAGLDLAGVCGWVGKYKGDPRYSGRSGLGSQPASVPSDSKLEFVLDEEAADNGEFHTQDEWIAYFNERNKRMASISDLYLAGKSNNQKLLDSLRGDFHYRWGVTSTRIEYGDDFNAKIIHNNGSTLIQPIEHKLIIPEYHPHLLEEVLNTKEGLSYLQGLFGTNDSVEQIKDTLQKLSDYPPDKIVVQSAPKSDRPTKRASGFMFNYGYIHVSGGINGSGCSRGVRLTR